MEFSSKRKEPQLIFKLSCRVTNLKGKYDALEWEACEDEGETQGHILTWKVIIGKKKKLKKCITINVTKEQLLSYFKKTLKY